jgi:hypothetical protein
VITAISPIFALAAGLAIGTTAAGARQRVPQYE